MPGNDATEPAAISSSIRSKDGTPIGYDRSGQGPPVLLVDGLVYSRHFGIMRPLASEIARRGFTVYAYDRRGRGESGSTEPCDMTREIEDLMIIARLADGPVHLFGMSTGAALALEAVRLDLKVRSLALFDTPFLVDDSRPPISKEFRVRLDELLAEGRLEDALTHFLSDHLLTPRLLLTSMRRSKTWPQSVAAAGVLSREVDLFADYFEGKPLPKARWARIKTPTLVMAGTRSAPWLKTTVGALAEALPKASARLLRGHGHMIKPAPLGEALAGFFSEVDEARKRALRL